ncbi:MAG: FKBP-type peptidyl-prolyl cis-trans isomerase [Tyzzerella sp.]|nr:FKBP-type peptidyl-prolyl cis-trans isomerase [Tyzzerella sp.]
MKKENKQMAQKRRAEERKKQARKDMIIKALKIGIPTLLLVLLIVICVVNPFSSSDSDSSSDDTTTEDTSTDDTSTDDTTAASYSTDTSLTVENGDTVNIDYVGSIDGVEFSGGNTNGYGTDLTIGSGTYIDDFEEQLIGAHPGDTVDVYATFPEDYGNEELNGKEALFEVVINGIYE